MKINIAIIVFILILGIVGYVALQFMNNTSKPISDQPTVVDINKEQPSIPLKDQKDLARDELIKDAQKHYKIIYNDYINKKYYESAVGLLDGGKIKNPDKMSKY